MSPGEFDCTHFPHVFALHSHGDPHRDPHNTLVSGLHLFQTFVSVCDGEASETFYAFKKRGECGNAFKVANDRGQFSHLQIKLVSPLWPLHKKITV